MEYAKIIASIMAKVTLVDTHMVARASDTGQEDSDLRKKTSFASAHIFIILEQKKQQALAKHWINTT